ncbi:MAG: hypothetical protein HYZ28_07815 [Myxococcales bacterium]|nr:hypothetical protein [Myxococcales bacterium]
MPSRIGTIAERALADLRVTEAEVDELVQEAKTDRKLSHQEKADLAQVIQQHSDRFDAAAKAKLEGFLASNAGVMDLADPAVLNKDSGSLGYSAVEGGQLFVESASYDDVVQGSIANCYMVSAFSALAHANPDLVKNAIRDNGDGSFTVRFHEQRGYGGAPQPVEVVVDGDLPSSALGPSRYGKARESKELWVSILEKAYAQWKGGYENIGNGGRAGEVMSAVTGRSSNWYSIGSTGADALFRTIRDGAASHRPMTAGTHGKDSGVDYSGTGVYAWHSYTVLGASEENGEKYVQLRNPWGRTEPGSDGRDDGIFKMKLSDFQRLYNSLYLG